MTFSTSFLADRVFWLRVRKIAKRAFRVSIVAGGGLAIASGIVPYPAAAVVLSTLAGVAGVVFLSAATSWIIARVSSWWLKGSIRWGIFTPKIRRAHLLAEFEAAVDTARTHNLFLVRVIHVYQVARRGTKCIVEHSEGIRQDAWFWYFNPRRGHVFMVRSTTGYGPHNSNSQVMYVGTHATGSGVVGGIPKAAWRVAQRR